MSPEQQAEKEYPDQYIMLYYSEKDAQGEVERITLLRAAFLSGVSWQKENGWLAYPENKPKYGELVWVFDSAAVIKQFSIFYMPTPQAEKEGVWMQNSLNIHIGNITHFRPLPPAPASIINK